jgi:hypothetical protein
MIRPPRPAQYAPNIEKLPRLMAAWRFGHDELPADISAYLVAQPEGKGVTVVSPNTGHSNLVRDGEWIIQSEVGCLYVVTDANFHKKYRTLPERTGFIARQRAKRHVLARLARLECERMHGSEP